MNITIDIDDVLLQNTNAFIEFLEEEGYKVKYEDFISRRVWEILSCSKGESERIILKFYKSKYFKDMKMMPDANEVLDKLKKKFNLYLVTNRPEFTKKDTLLLLKKYFSDSYKEIIFLGQFQKELHEKSLKKDVIEKQLKSIYCIEDDMDIIEQLDTRNTKIIIFAHPWNAEIENAKRVSNWKEIKNYILGV